MRTKQSRTPGARVARVGSVIRREVAALVPAAVDDPRVAGATFTEVDISPDLKQARIYVTHYRGEEAAHEAVRALNRASSHLRRILAPRLSLRVTPQLVFLYDPSVDQGFRIDALIRKARNEDGTTS